MENTYDTAQADTIGAAVMDRVAQSIREDGVAKSAGRLSRALVLIGFCIAAAAPQFAMGYATAAITWKGAALLKIAIVIGAFCYYRHVLRLWKWIRGKMNRRDPDGNQHTYHGIPIEQMTDYLIEQNGFQREHAIRHFGISRKRQFKIADELEKNGIVVRGEANGRVLHPTIKREQIVRQLRDGFPLIWSESIREWVERKGPFESWNLRQEHDERKRREEQERLERKVDRLERKRDTLAEEIEDAQEMKRAPGFFTKVVSAV